MQFKFMHKINIYAYNSMGVLLLEQLQLVKQQKQTLTKINKAKECFEKAVAIDDEFDVSKANLAALYYHSFNDAFTATNLSQKVPINIAWPFDCENEDLKFWKADDFIKHLSNSRKIIE